MSKEVKIALIAACGPLVLAAAGFVNAHAHKVEAETQRAEVYDVSDRFQDYIEDVMKQRGCEP